jgi:2,4-dienoyl-CoA reductase-like NADH-dependent reductase (Old Yellow Enzyme family)
MIREPEHAAEILANGRADLVFLARAVLADPAWPLRAARSLGVEVEWPPQYRRGVLTG